MTITIMTKSINDTCYRININ